MAYEKEYALALEAAMQAGNYLQSLGQAEVDSQEGHDIKLAADKKSETLIIDILRPTGISILSEESGSVGEGQGSRRWIVDPLDGTANFWKGIRELSCVSVALWEDGEPVLGVVNRFFTQEIYSGIVGEGAWLNQQPIHPSSVIHRKDAVLATGFPVKRDYGADSLASFIEKVQNFKKVRMLGAAAIMGAYVADGRIDAYMEEQIMLWDVAASSAIVKAAGGVTDVIPLKENQCVCRLFANRELYREYMHNTAIKE
jgi:myo-inositol-1(or 4)-monophosphatase